MQAIFNVGLVWFGPFILSFKFDSDPISGCWDIQLPLEVVFNWRSSSIGSRLPLEVVFISSNFWFLFGPLSVSLIYEEDLSNGSWDIKLLIFWGRFFFFFFFFLFGFGLGFSLGWLSFPVSNTWRSWKMWHYITY